MILILVAVLALFFSPDRRSGSTDRGSGRTSRVGPPGRWGGVVTGSAGPAKNQPTPSAVTSINTSSTAFIGIPARSSCASSDFSDEILHGVGVEFDQPAHSVACEASARDETAHRVR